MPYIITISTVSRRTVATLEEARRGCVDYISANKREPHRPWRAFYPMAETVSESGGTIGPLPDGTTIDVEPITVDALAYETAADASAETVKSLCERFRETS